MDKRKSYLVLFNICKRNNFGALVRTANAFGVEEIIIIGRRKHSRLGAIDTDRVTKRKHFFTVYEAKDYLKEKGCTICGVEIMKESIPIEEHPFQGNTAFVMGNEGTGLLDKQKAICDQFVYIKQFGTGASLNVNVATAIALHHYTLWGKFKPMPIVGEKFVYQQKKTESKLREK